MILFHFFEFKKWFNNTSTLLKKYDKIKKTKSYRLFIYLNLSDLKMTNRC